MADCEAELVSFGNDLRAWGILSYDYPISAGSKIGDLQAIIDKANLTPTPATETTPAVVPGLPLPGLVAATDLVSLWTYLALIQVAKTTPTTVVGQATSVLPAAIIAQIKGGGA
jgi:hypothetical protein